MITKKSKFERKKAGAPLPKAALFDEVAGIIAQAQQGVVRAVNTHMVLAYWLIGWRIVEAEQGGKKRAGYGERLIPTLAKQLTERFGKGYAKTNLADFRDFFNVFQDRADQILHALRGESGDEAIFYPVGGKLALPAIFHAVRGKSEEMEPISIKVDANAINEPPFRPELSWTHYRALMRVTKLTARDFYEQEAATARWSTRDLERQISSLYYERLLLSRNKKKMILENRKPAVNAHVAAALEVIKDPYVLEFLALPEHHTLNETELEARLVGQLKDFLMELGHGFAFIGRQQRLTLDGDHFYADLVFYHTRLKCYVVLDLKTKKLTHGDLGQMQLYVNYYDEEIAAEDDNPTLGLILCTDKNEAVCRYVLGKENQSIFTSRYQLHLPTEEQLAIELRRELALIHQGKA